MLSRFACLCISFNTKSKFKVVTCLSRFWQGLTFVGEITKLDLLHEKKSQRRRSLGVTWLVARASTSEAYCTNIMSNDGGALSLVKSQNWWVATFPHNHCFHQLWSIFKQQDLYHFCSPKTDLLYLPNHDVNFWKRRQPSKTSVRTIELLHHGQDHGLEREALIGA